MKTALHYCAESASLACADMILTAAPDLVDARDEDGYTSLHLAVIAGNRPLIKYLLSKNADVNSLDYERHSVVHWATGKWGPQFASTQTVSFSICHTCFSQSSFI
jgi:ankyrin repeat protein